jgi:hypothetical protein
MKSASSSEEGAGKDGAGIRNGEQGQQHQIFGPLHLVRGLFDDVRVVKIARMNELAQIEMFRNQPLDDAEVPGRNPDTLPDARGDGCRALVMISSQALADVVQQQGEAEQQFRFAIHPQAAKLVLVEGERLELRERDQRMLVHGLAVVVVAHHQAIDMLPFW